VIQPDSTALASPPVTFAWRPVAGASSYVLAIAENGEVSFTRETIDTTLTLSVELSPGEFRWWVRALRQDGTTLESTPRLLRITP
jgi:hypothetical protein